MSTSKLYTISYLNEFHNRTVYTLEEMQQIKTSQRWNGKQVYCPFDADVHDYVVINDTKTTRIIPNRTIILNNISFAVAIDETFVHANTKEYTNTISIKVFL